MQNSYEKKRRDLRRARMSVRRPSLSDIFHKTHPGFDWKDRPPDVSHRVWWVYCDQLEDEWIAKKVGWELSSLPTMGKAPAWFRRDLNRHQRRKELCTVRHAFLTDDWDGLVLPRYRRNAEWLWW